MNLARVPATLTAADCVDMHINMARALRTAKADQVLGALAEASPSGSAISAGVLAEAVDSADTFLVTAEMLRWAADAAVDLESMPLFPHDLPSPNMLILLDDADWRYTAGAIDDEFEQAIGDAPVRALSVVDVGRVYGDGASVSHFNVATGRNEQLGGVAMVLWVDAGVIAHNAHTAGALHTPRVPVEFGGLFPIDTTGWAFGAGWHTLTPTETLEQWDDIPNMPGAVAHHVGVMRRRLLSILLLMGQEVYATRHRVQDRPTRRRWKASSLMHPDDYSVGVTRLRRTHKHDDGTDPDPDQTPFHTHRWFVRGHWRRIARGTRQERAVWVKPHIKGPEHAPLVEKFRVTALDR